jgi:phosphatidylserine/phosphatidylglycerophosphate/cardiolipin synthase-like enzyme
MAHPSSLAHEFLDVWLDRLASDVEGDGGTTRQPPPVVFSLSGDDVHVLDTPRAFYDTLCAEIAGAERRVSLASLYIGHGDLERQLLTTVRRKLEETHLRAGRAAFDLTVVVDYTRALRRFPPHAAAASATEQLAAPPHEVVKRLGQASVLWQHVFGGGLADRLVAGPNRDDADVERAHTITAQIGLFKHPKFASSWLSERIPGFFRETVAVQHVKAYVVDDMVRCARMGWLVCDVMVTLVPLVRRCCVPAQVGLSPFSPRCGQKLA